jgi:hypothetical protein
MKKYVYGFGVFLLIVSTVAPALTIESVSIAQTSGVTASYYTVDQQTGEATINWSGGSSGLVLTDTTKFASFNDVSVTAQIYGITHQSSGGLAKATFSTGTWLMELGTGYPGGPVVQLGGTLASPYTEEELVDGDKLDGLAIVNVTTSQFDFGYFGDLWNIDPIMVQWGDGNGLGGLVSSILFPPGGGIDDYLSDYQSENVTITLVADETSIPEPATMLLLGLGSVLALRKRRV